MEQDNDSVASQQAEMTDEEKVARAEKLKKQISQLKEVIEDMNHKLETLHFGELDVNPSAVSAAAPPIRDQNGNIDEKLHLELHKLSGFWCSKCTDTELVFKFSATSNFKESSVIQLLVDDDKIKIGKYVLPWGIIPEYVIRETPLDRMSQTSGFLRNCKRHIHCHEKRSLQIAGLRKLTEGIRNIRVEGSLGNLSMYIKLYWVQNTQLNVQHEILICLFYESGEARPHIVKPGWDLGKKPDEEMYEQMVEFAKDFLKYDLEEAFEVFSTKVHPIFQWKPDRGENSQEVDLGYEYSTEEESEEGKPKRKRKQAKKLTAKKKKIEESQENDSFENSGDDNSPAKSINKSKNPKVTSSKAKKKPSAKKSTKSPASKKNQPDKRQTRLSFKGVPLEVSEETSGRQAATQKMRETSTPKAVSNDKVPQVSLVPIDVSSIDSNSSKKNRKRLKKDAGKK